MNTFILKDGVKTGPLSIDALKDGIASKSILLSDLIWIEATSEWKPITQVPMILDSIIPPLSKTSDFDFVPNADTNLSKQMPKTSIPSNIRLIYRAGVICSVLLLVSAVWIPVSAFSRSESFLFIGCSILLASIVAAFICVIAFSKPMLKRVETFLEIEKIEKSFSKK